MPRSNDYDICLLNSLVRHAVLGLCLGTLWLGAGLLEAQENAAVEDGRRMDEEALFISTSDGRFSPYGHLIDLLTVGPSTARYMVEYHLIPLVIARSDPFGNKTAVFSGPALSSYFALINRWRD